jgi:flagellar hook protein FlgE
MADALGAIPSGTRLVDIVIDRDTKSPAHATSEIQFAGNLDAAAAVYNPGPPPTGGTSDSAVPVFDSLGNEIALTLTYTKTGDNAWAWTATIPSGAGTTTVGSGTLTFNAGDGSLQSVTGNPITFDPGTGGAQLVINLDFGTPSPTAPGVFSGVTQTSGTSVVSVRDQDGYEAGSLQDISIDRGGRVLGTFTNGQVQTLAQIMLAELTNPAGMVRTGDNMYDISGNSGTPAVVDAGGTSNIVGGALEQSNVDLADEFTKMITAQRGFQANARVITTSDEFLQEVVNLKR